MTYKKMFGTGPLCFGAGSLLFVMVGLAERLLDVPEINIGDRASTIVFLFSILITSFFIAWTLVSLPPVRRGKEIMKKGAYRYVRHPLYASVLDFFVFGIGFYLKSWFLLFAGIALIFICGTLVEKEETLMLQWFGQGYEEYRKRTRKFIPFIY
ncbi:isoprenylcysteine carboxylmethyltransferase family protein [Candidatus Woesearchaeota archaeon]|nr:isoprenylcysteine carboxylmethyltransferase family protein [Candidatus Woesearchaeota archaeon]